MAEGLENVGNVPMSTGGTQGEENRGEQVMNVLDAEGTPVQEEVATFVDGVVGEEIRETAPVTVTAMVLSALTAPDGGVIENEASVRARFDVNNLPDNVSQAFIVGSTVDGETARFVSQTCFISNDRLRFCGEPVARIGANESGEFSGAVYTLAQLFEGNAFVLGLNRDTDQQHQVFGELGQTFTIPGTDTRLELAGGTFGPDAYGRLSLQWATRMGINVNLQVFIPEDGSAQPSITFSRRLGE